MTDNNTFSKVIKSCSTGKVEIDNVNAIVCRTCRSAVIAEYNVVLDMLNLYDFDPYYAYNQKTFHLHSADERTRNVVLEMFAAEKRLLYDVDPDDYCYRRR
jgi:hypothetical protein